MQKMARAKTRTEYEARRAADNEARAALRFEKARRLAINDFNYFRRWLAAGLGMQMKPSNWQDFAGAALQEFYSDFESGERPKLVIEAPPQHGKSRLIIEFLAWLAGKDARLKMIYTSFSERLGERANLQLQRIFSSERFRVTFPDFKTYEAKDNYSNLTKNRSLVEFGGGGFFRNTTVRGAITGETLDLGIIDDPIKSREEASSKAIRDKTWNWFTDDFFTRFSKDAGMLAILTRWHIDDPIGRLKLNNKNVKVLTFPALAVENDVLGRKVGEPLFPELKPLDFLLERKAAMANVNFEALYQQNPLVAGGQVIHVDYFKFYEKLPILKARAIFVDTAQKTSERNDYSVFECWGQDELGNVFLLDVLRGKWEAPELERMAYAFWAKHKALNNTSLGNLRFMAIEDKSSGTGLIQTIGRKIGMPLRAIQRFRDKYSRLLDVLASIESGYVHLPKDAPWLSDFLAECEAFSADGGHAHDDQIDTMVDALKYFGHNNNVAIFERMM